MQEKDIDVSKHHSINRKNLIFTVLIRLISAILLLSVVFFLPAGTFDYWEAWVYMGTLIGMMVLLMFYLLINDPDLLERRMKMKEKEPEQQRIIKISYIFFIGTFLTPGLDHRFHWSSVPNGIVFMALGLVMVGYLLFIWVLKENSYASRIIEVTPDQTVVTTGPYAWVRHPMYLANSLMYVFSPLALGSYWAMVATPILVMILVLRIKNEEKVLNSLLKGYPEYVRKTKYRMIPGIW